jgi:uncharacterized membrane protein
LSAESNAGGEPAIFPSEARDYVTVLAHYYRGEMSRMISWRKRIDLTTNWAIGAVAGMLSLSLSTPGASHGVLVFAMLIVLLILFIEARRYRFFDIYRSRVRLIERHYYSRVLTGVDIAEGEDWLEKLADDLRAPRFSLSLPQALSRRLRRNYVWMFLILLLAWLLKMSGLLVEGGAAGEPMLSHAAIGAIPGWIVASGIGLFHAMLAALTFGHREAPGELAYGDAHV